MTKTMAAHAESIGSESSRTQNQIDKLAAEPTPIGILSAEGRSAARELLYDIYEQRAAKAARKLGRMLLEAAEPAEPQTATTTAEPAEPAVEPDPEADDDEEETQRF